MKKLFLSLALVLAVGTAAHAQWVVTDPTHIVTSIVNMAKNVAQTSTTASNMVNTFKETKRIYEQSKKYYDALRSVNNLVKDARKARETILIVGDISTIYIDNFQKMLSDGNYTVDELSAIGAGYGKLLQEGANLLLDLKEAVSVTGLSMNDKERMEIIDAVYRDAVRMRGLTNYYTRKNISVSLIRAKEQGDLARVVELYGTNEQRYW
jgi:hypothetical protein